MVVPSVQLAWRSGFSLKSFRRFGPDRFHFAMRRRSSCCASVISVSRHSQFESFSQCGTTSSGGVEHVDGRLKLQPCVSRRKNRDLRTRLIAPLWPPMCDSTNSKEGDSMVQDLWDSMGFLALKASGALCRPFGTTATDRFPVWAFQSSINPLQHLTLSPAMLERTRNVRSVRSPTASPLLGSQIRS
jgi:hypothetical protein